jgi:hypothetical protein
MITYRLTLTFDLRSLNLNLFLVTRHQKMVLTPSGEALLLSLYLTLKVNVSASGIAATLGNTRYVA